MKKVCVHMAFEVDDDMSIETVLDSLRWVFFPSVNGDENYIVVREADALDDFTPDDAGGFG